jgi:uncharacterized protein (DUF58 family)
MSSVARYLDPALLERLRTYQLSARSVVEGTTLGQHRSPVRGASVEFRQHRAYVPGDEPRRLDWRVLARTDRPYVREYHEETNLRCMLLLDRSGSMSYRGRGRASKFDYAAKVVASLAYLMLNSGESVGVATCGQRIEHWLGPHAATQQLARVIDVLERTSPADRSDIARAMHDAADRIGRRSLLVVVSDLLSDVGPLRAALSRLRHARHELIVLRVLDDDEIAFPFDRWLRLRGLEGEGTRLCEPAIVRQQYQAAFAEHEKALHGACRAADVEVHTFVTSRDIGDAMSGFLKHRAR